MSSLKTLKKEKGTIEPTENADRVALPRFPSVLIGVKGEQMAGH